MKKTLLLPVMAALTWICFFNSCKSSASAGYNDLPDDAETITKGKMLFSLHCSGCHAIRREGIGPKLEGSTQKVSADWLRAFIKNPQEIISSGDKHAHELITQYKTIMPSFPSLKEDELTAIIAFLHTQQRPIKPLVRDSSVGISNPIPDPISLSKLVVDLEPIAQFPATSEAGQLPLARITKLDFQPGTGHLFVNDLRGILYILKNNKPQVYMDMAKLIPRFIHQPGLGTGFGSFAFHPGFSRNGLIYTAHTESAGPVKADFDYADSIEVTVQWVINEWKADNTNAETFSGTSRELFRVNMVTGIHGVQELTFNPLSKPGSEDYGLLYIGVGDGGSTENGYAFLTHSTEKIWGTVLRIDPAGRNSSNGHYGIPKTNPFVNGQKNKTLAEIYAFGFRNPHRITWIRWGQMLVTNIGQAHIESLNLTEPGHDYGWPLREGRFALNPSGDMEKLFPLPANDSIYHITYPVAAFDHDEGIAISGGYEYWGSSIPQLQGKFLFGDIPSGRLFYTETADLKLGKLADIREWKITINSVDKTLKQACGNDRVDLHFGRDAKGELYILTKADGRLYKLRNAGTKN